MASSNEQGPAASEFRAFLAFASSVWGALASASVLFPLSNELLGVIPLAKPTDDPAGAMARIPLELVVTLATVAALFTVFWLFARRQESTTHPANEKWRTPALMFVLGFVLLVCYLVVYEVKLANVEEWGWDSDSAANLLLDVPLLLLYSGFFVSVTAAFVKVALRMFFARQGPESFEMRCN